MADHDKQTVSLTPELAAFVESCVSSGEYASTGEVVRAGIRLLADQQTKESAAVTARLRRGMSDFDAGRHRPAKAALRSIADEFDLVIQR